MTQIFNLFFIRRFNYFLLFSLPILISFCNSPDKNPKNTGEQKGVFPYDLLKPTERYLLPLQLREVSGLAWHEGNILCIQDESADIYLFDPAQKKVASTLHFNFKGDFEDISVAGDTAYLLKSNGKILEINEFNSGSPEITEHDTPLKAGNDTEGLAYDHSINSLLVSCKGYPDIEEKNRYKGSKTVYRFDLAGKRLEHDPYFVINLKNPACFADAALFAKLRNTAAGIPELDGFQPSGLTLNPSTGEIYMISSSGRLILIINEEGEITNFGFLPMNIFTQPEGICFSPAGDLYISNEGRAGNGYILRFAPK